MFRSSDHLRGAKLCLANVTLLKHSLNNFLILTNYSVSVFKNVTLTSNSLAL